MVLLLQAVLQLQLPAFTTLPSWRLSVCLSGWCGAYYANAHYAHTRNGRGVVGIKLGHVQINQFWRWNILF